MNRPKSSGLVALWLTLMAIWLVSNDSLATDVVITGLIIATVLTFALAAFSRAYADIRITPRALLHHVLYFAVFAWELVKANLNVLRIVLSPRIDIHPGIVKVRTRLQSRTGRLVLANSITLTPGTLVVDIDDDTLYVHWIDVATHDPEEATRAIAAKFEKHLEVMYG